MIKGFQPMIVLALDTSTVLPAVALAAGGEERDLALPSGAQTSEVLLAAIGQLLAEFDLTLSRVERFVVLAGPGSFTGIRVGLATVWGFARVVPAAVERVGSLEAVAETVRGRGTTVCAAFDAQRGELYTGRYDITAPRALEIESPRILAAPALAEFARPEDVTVTLSAGSRHLISPALAAARQAQRSPAAGGTLVPIYVRSAAAEERRGISAS